MRRRAAIWKKLTVFLMALVMMFAAVPAVLPQRSTVWAAGISKSKAISKALGDAGFTKSSVTLLKARQDYDYDDDDDDDEDDHEWKISFRKGGYRYKYEISGSGRILSKEYRIITVKRSSGKQQISKKKARKIAYRKAGVKSGSDLEIKKKTYRSKARVWEVSFEKGRKEWEFKIDRYSGKILEMDYEYDD